MKKIEDYLHLYLGCEVWDDYDQNYKVLISVDLQEQNCRIATNGRVTQHLRKLNEVKPILRPLSDMSGKEFKKYNSYLFTTEFAIGDYTRTEHYAEMTRYLLSKNFDLFGLIEAGLAIDKTKTTK